jgi:hypothetical protein
MYSVILVSVFFITFGKKLMDFFLHTHVAVLFNMSKVEAGGWILCSA